MSVRKYRMLLSIALIAAVIFGGHYTAKQADREELKREVSARTSASNMVIPGGMPVGIYMETDGVMVLGTDKIEGADGKMQEPARNLVKEGDYIVGIDDKEIDNKKELIRAVSTIEGNTAILHLRRDDELLAVRIQPAETKNGEKKLGIWVRDNVQGLGTVTFLTGDSQFGALGHGIHDADTGELVDLSEGRLYGTSIASIQKGTSGSPGGMEGIIVYNKYNVIGSITENTECGIFGTVDKIEEVFQDQTPMEVGTKEEIEEGDALIRCSVEGEVKDYQIKIRKVNLKAREANKGIVIEVTDPDLLEVTGGIVQGMSGSPIIQKGKLVGAVTHVFVNDPTRGYGIFIENMLDAAG